MKKFATCLVAAVLPLAAQEVPKNQIVFPVVWCKDFTISDRGAEKKNENGEGVRQLHFKNGKEVCESDPDLTDEKTLKKILGSTGKWKTLQKDELTELYHLPDNPEPYTGWIQKLHDNGKVALLGSLKDGKPDGLWTWWDENGIKEDEKRCNPASPWSHQNEITWQ